MESITLEKVLKLGEATRLGNKKFIQRRFTKNVILTEG
jgi:hypothetical protein